MTVKELIGLLKDMPEDGIVSIGNTDEGFSEAKSAVVYNRWAVKDSFGGLHIFHEELAGATRNGYDVMIAGGVYD